MSMSSRQATSILVMALSFLVVPAIANAVGANFGTTPQAFAVTYLNEDWSDTQSAAFGFYDWTDRPTGPTSASSFQERGIDIGGPGQGCAPPCVGHTAGAESAFLNGGIVLRSYAHAYANFDHYYVIGDPPSQQYIPGYDSGNIVRAESAAAVLDRFTVTQTVDVQINGHISGRSATTATSDSATYAAQLGNVGFGNGNTTGQIIVTVNPTPVGSSSNQLIVQSFPAFNGQNLLVDQPLAATFRLAPGTYTFTAQLTSTTRIGAVTFADLATQSRLSDYGDTVTLELVAANPAAISSQSGQINFLPEPTVGALGAGSLMLLGIARRRRGPAS